MAGKATILDVCRETGYSVATVSRVVNRSPKVSEQTKEEILSAIQRLGYKPNAAARSLSGQKSNTLGVIFHQITSGFYASVMSGIDLEARTHGYHVLITIAHHMDPGRAEYYDMLDEARVDGMIILDSTLTDDIIDRLKTYDRPLVLVQRTLDDPGVATVSSANEEAAYTALKHLLSLGYRDLLLVTGSPEAEDSSLRMDGCRRALREVDVSIDDVAVIGGQYSAHEALVAFTDYIAEHKMPRAIFAFNDDMALSIMKDLRLRGVRVPEEVAIVGFDGTEAADYMGLTTMAMPMLEIGQEAVRALIHCLRNPLAPLSHAVKSCELIVRESCGA